MDPKVVTDHLLGEAGIADLDAINDHLTSIRDELTTLKEQGISLLTVACSTVNDAFIDRKATEVDGIVIADPATIAADIARDGPNWSRDSEAVSQGRRIAAHQRLKAVCLSAGVSENGLNLLQRVLREAAAHMLQLDGTRRSAAGAPKHVFIGHGQAHHETRFVDMELKTAPQDRDYQAVHSTVSRVIIPRGRRVVETGVRRF
jgi:hypothetical protein